MPNWKKEKKSRSVNDIPVEKKHDHIIHSLDDGAFQDLLTKVSQPSYCKNSPHLDFNSDLGSETNALVKVCEQGLRDEDAAKQEKKRKKAAFAYRNSRGGRNSCSRSISPEDIYMNRNTKPVEFDKMNLDYIDNDIEMTDLSGTTTQPMRYTKGNTEDTVLELRQEDVELGEGGLDRDTDFICKANERQLQARGRVLLADESVLPPQNEGMFSALSYDMIGTDELPTLSPSLMPLPQTAQRVHIPANGTFRTSDDGKSQDGSASAASAAALKREGRKKKKKEREAKNTFFAENVKGYMGELPLDQLLNLIEGEPVPCESVKKQKGQQTTTESEDPVRKSRRRKSKESKDIKEDAVSPTNLVTIGNHQDKAPLAPSNDQDLSPTLSLKTSMKEPVAVTVIAANPSNITRAQNISSSKISPKRRKSNGPTNHVPSTENAGARIGRFSTEDAEEEFLSADEGVALSPGEEIMSSNAIVSSDVMLDGANYRADDEDVTIVERQATEEQEFITVSGKAKKKVHHQQTTRTGSSSNMKSERRSKATTEQRPELPPQRRNSLEERVSSNNKNRRPTTTSLADFMDDKKQENKAPATRQTTPPKRKSVRYERPESTADSEQSYHDAPCDEMAPTAVNGTPSPERAFSYADAAKKSSDSNGGRDHSPSESAKPNSNHNDISSKAVEIVGSQGSSGAEIPNGPASSTGLSFFYDENEATNTDNKPSEDNAFVLNLGGKTVRFAKGLAANNVEPNQRHLSMIELMTQRWESFLKGPAPMHYTAKTSPV